MLQQLSEVARVSHDGLVEQVENRQLTSLVGDQVWSPGLTMQYFT